MATSLRINLCTNTPTVDPEDEGDDTGKAVSDSIAAHDFIARRPGKHHTQWLPIGSDPPPNFPPDSIKDYDRSQILPPDAIIDSLLDTFDLFFPLTLINYLARNTNQKADILFATGSPTNFLLYWVNMTSSKFYEF